MVAIISNEKARDESASPRNGPEIDDLSNLHRLFHTHSQDQVMEWAGGQLIGDPLLGKCAQNTEIWTDL